jgi:hypothetical protein
LNPGNAYKQLVKSVFRLEKAEFFNNPFFIVSCGRSGSTALCLALRLHPSLLVAATEGPSVNSLGELAHDYALGEYSGYFQKASRLEPNETRRQLRRLCYTSIFGLDLGMSYDPRRWRFKESAYTRGYKIGRWGAKVFPTRKSAQGLRWLYPGAKFVYIFRNGVDVVHSMSKFGTFAKLDFASRCRFWSDRAETYAFLQTWDDVCVIRFEDFLDDNASVLKRTCEYLGFPDSRATSEFASTSMIHPLDSPTEKLNPKETIAARNSSFEQWTGDERNVFKDICGGAMKMLGYEIPF